MLAKIILGGFKHFNSILTKARIQTGSSSEYFKSLFVQSRRLKSRWSPKYFEILPS